MSRGAYHPASDLVVLVPGFLGFEALADYSYFDEVLIDALRHALGARQWMAGGHGGHSDFAIETINTVPAGSLVQRQAALVSELGELLEHPAYFDVERVHLIGHSAGGLDARLLLAERRLDGRPWARPEDELRARIRSVLCLAAPQHGTRLVAHPDIQELTRSLPRFLARHALDPEIIGIIASGLRDMDLADILRGALRRPAQAWALIKSVVEHRKLLHDLQPESMPRHRDALPSLRGVHFGSIVTLAADHVELPAAAPRDGLLGALERRVSDLRGRRAAPRARRGDAIFRWLRARTANPCWEVDDAQDARIEAIAAQRIQDALDMRAGTRGVPVISNPRAVLPCPIDGRVNDGIVNSARQLLYADDDAELVGIVVADHLDVIGHFDKVPNPRCPEDQGLIKSGSGFSHEQLHRMCELMAERIASASVRSRPDSGVVSVAPPAAAP